MFSLFCIWRICFFCYCIDKRSVYVIANMPVEKVDDVAYVANAQEWTGAGADSARRKLSNAIWSDTQRTIVTPTPADKFNMMTGVIRINNEEYANLLDNNFFRMLGYTKTDMGGKFSNAYMGLPFQFFSWGIAANRKVKFLVTAEDVIHAWWVPDFGIKRDAVPGIINELWAIVPEPGTYRGQCTELCGKDHGFMPIVVEVLPEREFDLWYQDKVAEKIAIDQSTKKQADSTFLTVSSGG